MPPSSHPSLSALALVSGLCGCAAGAGEQLATPFERDAGTFGRPAVQNEPGSSDGGPGDLDGGAGNSGPAVTARLIHGIPNLGSLVLCRFDALTLDDLATPDVDELDRDHAPGELLGGTALAQGIAFGEVSGWFSVPIDGTGVLSLHRIAAAPLDGGLPSEAGTDASAAPDAGTDAQPAGDGEAVPEALPPDPCDPNSIELALTLPLAGNTLPPPPLPPLLALDAGLYDAAIPSNDAGEGDGAATPNDSATPVPTVSELLASRGISSTLPGGARITLFASGLGLAPAALAQRAADATASALAANPGDPAAATAVGLEAVRAIDRAVGARLLISEVPQASSAGFNLSLAHLVPDLALGGAAPAGAAGPAAVRACITIDGVEGTVLPSRAAQPVGFREHLLLAPELAPRSSYRIRVFSADDFSAPGQDCANTTRAPLGELLLSPNVYTAGSSYSLVVAGLASPESLCATGSMSSGVARPGCFGAGEHTTMLLVAEP